MAIADATDEVTGNTSSVLFQPPPRLTLCFPSGNSSIAIISPIIIITDEPPSPSAWYHHQAALVKQLNSIVIITSYHCQPPSPSNAAAGNHHRPITAPPTSFRVEDPSLSFPVRDRNSPWEKLLSSSSATRLFLSVAEPPQNPSPPPQISSNRTSYTGNEFKWASGCTLGPVAHWASNPYLGPVRPNKSNGLQIAV